MGTLVVYHSHHSLGGEWFTRWCFLSIYGSKDGSRHGFLEGLPRHTDICFFVACAAGDALPQEVCQLWWEDWHIFSHAGRYWKILNIGGKPRCQLVICTCGGLHKESCGCEGLPSTISVSLSHPIHVGLHHFLEFFHVLPGIFHNGPLGFIFWQKRHFCGETMVQG